jgi:hypothetical protein
MKKVCIVIAIVLQVVFLSACPDSSSPGGVITIPTPTDFPTTATLCTTYSYNFSVPATITSNGVPAWLSLSGQSLSGMPEGNDFGDFDLSVSGAYKSKTGTVTATIKVGPPAMTLAGGPFDIVLHGSNVSNSVTVTIAPSNPSCVYKVTLTKRDWQANRIVLPGPEMTVTGGKSPLTISVETDVAGDGEVFLKIVPVGKNAVPVVAVIPVHAHS